MAQDNSKVNEVINFLKSRQQSGAGISDPVVDFLNQNRANQGQPAFKRNPLAEAAYKSGVDRVKEGAANYEIANRIAEGDTNLFGATLRILTGLGRGITNGAYDVMEKANVMFDRLNDGEVTTEDFFSTAADIVATPFAFAGGALRGIAGSAPGTEGAIQKATGRPVIENWYELFKSPEFAKSVENIPALDIARSDKEVFGEGTWFTPSGIISTILDIGLDPATFATLGVGGAVKGAAQGVRNVAGVRKAAAAGTAKPGEFVARNVYDRITPKPQVGDAIETLQGGTFGATNYILKSAGSGFVDAHKRAIARIEARRALKGPKAAMLSKAEDLAGAELETAKSAVDEMVELNIAKLKESTKKSQDEINAATEEIRAAGASVKELMDRTWNDIPTAPEREQVLSAAREAAETPTVRPTAVSKPIADKLAAEQALIGTPKVAPLVERRTQKWLENPESVAKLARDLETAVLNGEVVNIEDLSKVLTPKDLKRVEELLANPLGYRERAAKKAGKEGEEATLAVTASGKAITEGDLRTMQQAITGTKLSRSVTEFVSSKEGLRVMSLLSGLSKKINKAGSKTTGAKSLNTLRNVEELFYTPQNLKSVPASVLYARLSFLAERAANTESDAFVAINRYKKSEFNPLTEQANHPIPSNFAIMGTKSADKPYFLTEIMEAGRVIAGKNFSRELIETLDKVGVSLVKVDEAGHPVLRTAEEVQELLVQAMTKNAVQEAQREANKVFTRLKKQYPELTKENVESVLKPAEYESLQAVISRAPQIAQEKIDRLLAELNPAEDVIGNAHKLFESAGIDFFGRGAAFRVLAEGRMAFRDFKTLQNADLSDLKRTLKNVKVLGDKPREMTGRQAFGRLFTEFERLGTQDAREQVSRGAAQNIAEFLKPFANSENVLQPAEIRQILVQASNLLEKSAKESTNATNNFLSLFADRTGTVQNDWVIRAGIDAYKASVKAGARDNGVFASIVDKRVGEVIRKNKAELLNIKKGSKEYDELVRLTFRDWYGPGVIWDGAGLSNWTVLDILRNTGKANSKPLPQAEREALIKNIPAMIERVKDRVWEFALREERLNFPVEFDKQTFAKEILEGRAVTGLKINQVEQDALVEGAQKFMYGLSGEAGNVMRRLLEIPEVAPAVKAFLGKVGRNEKNAILPLNNKQRKDLMGLLGVKNTEVARLRGQLSVIFANQFARSAKKLVENMRKEALIGKNLPDFISPTELASAIKKSGAAATTNVMMRLMLAENVLTADMAVKAVDRAAASVRTSTVDLVKERKSFETMLNKFETTAAKATGLKPVKANDPALESVTIDDFAPGGAHEGNPMMLIAKIRTLQVNGNAEKAKEWSNYLDLLLATNIPKGQYRSIKDINAEALLKPEGSEALKRLAGLLADAGDSRMLKTLERGGTPRQQTIEAALEKVRKGGSISPAELDAFVAPGSIADEMGIAAAKEVEEFTASLQPDQMIAEDYTAHIEALLRFYWNAGQHHIPDITALYTGAIAQRHILWRSESVRFIKRTLDDVILDTNLPASKKVLTDPQSEFMMMRTVEPQAVLTGSKVVYRKLSELAEAAGYKAGTPERAAFMRQNFEQIENLGEAQLKRLGMQFAFTLKEGTGEAGMLNLYGAKSLKELAETRPAAIKTVYLSLADVKQALPAEVTERLFYAGSSESIPETAVSGAVRLAVALRTELETGREFSGEIANGLKQVMFDLIRAEIKTNTSLFSQGKKGANFFNNNPELATEKISEFIDNLLEPEVLDGLVTAHIKNSAFAIKMNRNKVDRVLGASIKKLEAVLNNPALSGGDRVQAMVKTYNEFEKLYKNRSYSDVVKNTARFDLHTLMVARMSKDDMNTFVAALYKDKELTGEAAEIAKVQKKSAKEVTDVLQTSLKIEADSFEQALQNAEAMNIIKAAENGTLTDDLVHEMANESGAAIGQAMHARRFGILNATDQMFERLFFGYGADYIMPLVNPLQRVIQEQVTTKTEHFTRLAQDLDAMGAGREVRIKATKIIQAIAKTDDELLGDAAAHHIRVQTAIAKGETISAEEAAIAADALDKLRPIFQELGASVEDKAMLEAVTRLSQHFNEIFGGGNHSLVATAGLNPTYLNEMISQVGGKDLAFFGGKDADAILNSWKEWPLDQVDPLEALRIWHAGLKHAAIIPMSAMTITKNIGIPKSAYSNLAAAKADGLDELATVAMPSAGQRLLHFIDTENYYYPAHLIPEIKQASKVIDQETRLASDAQFLQSLDRVQNRAKQFMTTLRPGNWVQNMIGGFTVNAFKGLWNPLRYAQATRMVKDNVVGGLPFIKESNSVALKNAGIPVGAADEWAARYIKSMGDQGYVVKPESALDSGKVQVLIGNRRVNYNEADIMELYRRQGGFVTSSAVFDPIDETLRPGKALRNSAFQKFTTNVGRWSANRDDILRMSLYLELMKKQGGKSLEEASRTALREVNRVHPQMQDLSKFNQKWAKRTIMFFTWRAKTLGFLITEMLDQPGAILAFQKAYTNTMLSQGLDVEIGDLQPKNVPLRSYMEGNMNVMLPGANSEGLWSMSFANPVNDLFGSSGWLSGVSLNSYEPVQNQVLGWGSTTFKNVFASSDPLIISLLVDWGFGQKTGQGTQFADSPDAVPLLVEDAFSRMGLKPAHTLLALAFPDTFKRVAWEGKRMDKVEEEAYLEFVNWVSGLRLKQVDKPEDRKKAIQELLGKITQYQRIEVNQERKNLGG